ncbi:MAG: SRPBCC family protein [Bacteroidota bacterium]
MKPHILETTTIIKRPLSDVFDFFGKAENLNLLTPPELDFTITSPLPIQMKTGAIINYRIKLNGIPFTWRTEICEWNPPHQFVDTQVKGPYVRWHHTHRFKEINGITEMTDRIEFLSPGWILEPLINILFVERKVKQIFAYREQQLNSIFA